MREPDREDLASHSGPTSCDMAREGRGVSSDEKATGDPRSGVRAGQPLSPEKNDIWAADAVALRGRQQEVVPLLAMGLPQPTGSETLRTHGNSSHGRRESPRLAVMDGITVRSENPKGAML